MIVEFPHFFASREQVSAKHVVVFMSLPVPALHKIRSMVMGVGGEDCLGVHQMLLQ